MQPFCNPIPVERRAYTGCTPEGGAVSTQRADGPDHGRTPTREELLRWATPLPPIEEMVIEDLSDEEEEAFLEAIADA